MESDDEKIQQRAKTRERIERQCTVKTTEGYREPQITTRTYGGFTTRVITINT